MEVDVRLILFILLLSSLLLNLGLAYKLDSIKTEVLDNCNAKYEKYFEDNLIGEYEFKKQIDENS